MIYLYSGTPGSGKSLHIARMIYNSLGAGYACICNFQIDLNKIHRNNGKFCYRDNEELTPSFLRAYSDSYFGFGFLLMKHSFFLMLVTGARKAVMTGSPFLRSIDI